MKVHMVVTSYRTPLDLDAFCRSVQQWPIQMDWSLAIVNVSPLPEDLACGERWADLLGASHTWTEDNAGYGRACNRGASCARWVGEGIRRDCDDGDSEGVLAFFNADVMLTEGAVDACVSGLLSHDDWGVLGPRQVDSRGRLTHAGIFGTQAAPKHRAWRASGANGEYSDVRDDAVTVSGSALFVRRTVWDELRLCPLFRKIASGALGAFLPTPHYYEETWLNYHAAAHGRKVVYFGAVTVRHEWHQASAVGGYAEQQMPKSQRIFRDACDFHDIPHD